MIPRSTSRHRGAKITAYTKPNHLPRTKLGSLTQWDRVLIMAHPGGFRWDSEELMTKPRRRGSTCVMWSK